MELANVIFLCIFSTVLVLGMVKGDSITVTSCGDTSRELVKLKKFEYSPNPISLPGHITLNVELDLLQDIVAPVAINTAIEVSVNGMPLQIPCINGLGSCYHSNICDKLATIDCPDFFKEHNLQCQCPFKKGTISLKDLKLYIPLGETQGDDFHIQVEFYTNNAFALCLDIRATLDSY